jgi:hypothetical protein
MKSKLYFKTIVYLLVFSSYLILLLEDKYVIRLTYEDGLVEDLGAIFFIMTSGLFFLAYYRSSQSKNGTYVPHKNNRRNIFYLLLGMLFLICFGEEISWGQRIFNVETPALLKAINSQRETNIHNIWILNGRLPGMHYKPVYGIRINMNSGFSVFWLLFCVMVQLMEKVSIRANSILEKVGFPIAPFWIGGLFLSHAIFFHVIYNFLPYSLPGRIDELRETNYAFMLFIFACHVNTYIKKEQIN